VSVEFAVGNSSVLRAKVLEAYSSAGKRPFDKHSFSVGRAFAERLGYSAALLASLPAVAVESFAGVSNITSSPLFVNPQPFSI